MIADTLGISEVMRSSAFWVLFTMATFLLALIFHSYWTNWAHQRLDVLRKEMDELKEECEKMKSEVADIKQRNPFTLLTKVNNR